MGKFLLQIKSFLLGSGGPLGVFCTIFVEDSLRNEEGLARVIFVVIFVLGLGLGLDLGGRV